MCEIRLLFPVAIRKCLPGDGWLDELEEIRVRVGQPVEFCYRTGVRYLKKEGQTIKFCGEKDGEQELGEIYRATQSDIREMLTYMSEYSLYACQEQIRQGFLTIEGGHRIGLAGQATIRDGKITGISPVTFLNIRVAHERIGCAREFLPFLTQGETIYNTLILSAPGAGKTTLLRDAVRALSDGELSGVKYKVGVVDERSELAAMCHGIPQNRIGMRTDVLDNCPKAEGIRLLIRAMSPQIIAVDELGREEDFLAVEEAVTCGCRLLGTLHAGSMQELSEKPRLRRWMEQRFFERFILLQRGVDGRRHFMVYDAHMEKITC